MDIIERFESFAGDFERCVDDDNWSRLERYFASDATYLNVGGPDTKCESREAILDFFNKDVSSFDRRFDARRLTAITLPVAEGNLLSRQWRCAYTLAGVPDLVVEGEARYWFDGDFIKAIEQELTPGSQQALAEWMVNYGDRLQT